MSKRYSKKEKAHLLKELRASGLSIPAFSRKTGIADVTLYKWRKESKVPAEESRGDFIEVGGALHYEIQRGAVILRVPATERVARLAELMNEL